MVTTFSLRIINTRTCKKLYNKRDLKTAKTNSIDEIDLIEDRKNKQEDADSSNEFFEKIRKLENKTVNRSRYIFKSIMNLYNTNKSSEERTNRLPYILKNYRNYFETMLCSTNKKEINTELSTVNFIDI